MWKSISPIFLFVVAVAFFVYSTHGFGQSVVVAKERYIETKLDWMSICGEPPSPGSVEDEKEIGILLWLQKTRNAMAVSQGWYYADVTISSFQEPLNFPIEMPHATKITETFNQIIVEADVILKSVKKKVKRKRPFDVIHELKPSLPLPHSWSFPSGHAMRGALAGILLSDLFPNRKEQIIKRGDFIGEMRVLVGEHYPSDVEAGQRLGKALSAEVLQSQAWKNFKLENADEIAYIKSQIRKDDKEHHQKQNQ